MQYRINRKTQSWYGEAIGILILNAAYPCVPGNVGNATTFHFPVRYAEVQGASIDRLLNQRDPELIEPFIRAAKDLQDQGVRAITGACGFMALFQQQVSRAVEIPVFLSSLLQIPFIHRITGKSIGIITANSSCLTEAHFQACGIDASVPLVVAGMENRKEFREAILEEKGSLDSTKIEEEAVEVAMTMIKKHPEIGAILLECSDLPPYAYKIQECTNLPVFDFITMINFVHNTLVHLPFIGHL